VSQKSNERYAESLATVDSKTPLSELTKDLGQPTKWHGRRVRALNPLAADDVALLEIVMRGENLLNGLRNRDVRKHLYGHNEVDAKEKRRQTTAVTRKLQMLRAHGLITKINRTHRYQISTKGQEQIAAWLAARAATTANLKQAA
jgi:predicted pyridoxine 5'-phosphate oxidase superfamily flavin-nucleotide-binding protein